MNTLLFPSSFDDPTLVDEDMIAEYESAESSGLFDIYLFNYEKWFIDGRLSMRQYPDSPVTAVYRGWMMTPEKYEKFYMALKTKNISLLTCPAAYRNLHAFPHVYPLLEEHTARILTFPLHEPIDIEKVKNLLPRFMVKDYVKSVKGSDFPSYFDQSITQDSFNHWMDLFYEYRGDLLTEGICIKEYRDFKQYDSHTNEYRAFYLNGRVISLCPNSGQPQCVPQPSREFVELFSNLPSPFYTVDFAEMQNGDWTIIETGDGQVSGLCACQDYAAFFKEIHG